MRLTHIHARDFLSFGELTLDLDPHLNVIVGPNGAGKSNLARAVSVAVSALQWTFETASYDSLRRYTAATRQGVQPERFCVRVGVELDRQHEREMLVAWLRMALLSTVANRNQSLSDGLDTYLLRSIDKQAVEVLSHGSVGVLFERIPADRFFVGYEFDVDGQTYCYVLRGDRMGGIVYGRLDEQEPGGGLTRHPDLLLTDEQLVDPSASDIPFDFKVDRLLPDKGGFVELNVQPLHNWQQTGTVHEFMRICGVGVENRTHMLDVVLTRLFAEIAVVNECRGLPHKLYSADELTTQAAYYETADVPLELLHLKNGDHVQQQRFKRVQGLFQTLTGVGFDLRLRAAPEPAANDVSTSGRSVQIDVDVIDRNAPVPLEFSGAGRWEALVLSTALAAQGTTAILDEPALNLHPTLQRRLLQTIREGTSQTLLVTHSPFLVPAEGQAEIERIVRLTRNEEQTIIHRATFDQEPSRERDATVSKLQQIMVSSSDVRALLFATAVLLVEGDTEVGALDIWLPQTASDLRLPSPHDLNLVVASVDGDSSFGRYASYLEMFGVPWTILCDGKALSPRDQKWIGRQMQSKPGGGAPAEDADFATWRDAWETCGVFTLAGSFDDEIEAVLSRDNPDAWSEMAVRYGRSKVRAGRAFAERAVSPDGLDRLYTQILRHLDLAPGL
jgi:hypothetical protein